MWLFKKTKQTPEPKLKGGPFSTSRSVVSREPLESELQQPRGVVGMAMDAAFSRIKQTAFGHGVPQAQSDWYVSQGFIGYHLMAHIAKHWLVDKAIGMPARDAIRNGYKINCDHAEVIEQLNEASKDRNIIGTLKEQIVKGRQMGGAAALFVIESTDPEYYEKPFNIDGVTKGSYKGIRVIDANWMTPELTAGSIQDPASLEFYNPTFWIIAGKRYHKSHFSIFVPYPVAELNKNQYRFFGVSVPERIYERVYAAERTANEMPQLALTKRLLTMGIPGLGDADSDTIAENMEYFSEIRDNYGVNISDSETVFQQFDTALADVDTITMTQYQLVAAGAGVPATKLLGTSPKGFDATGQSEAEDYRQELESIQTNDLLPLLNRHYDVLCRDLDLADHDITISFEPLDSPTAKEWAEINASKAATAEAYQRTGAIDGQDIRKQLVADPDSDFYGIGQEEEADLSAWLDDETNEES